MNIFDHRRVRNDGSRVAGVVGPQVGVPLGDPVGPQLGPVNAEMPDWDQIAVIQTDRVLYKGWGAGGLKTEAPGPKG